VTEPVGWKAVPAVKLAESLEVPPIVMLVADGVVVMVGVVFTTTTGSQGLVAGLLLESPR
jgi:hypothetical protein